MGFLLSCAARSDGRPHGQPQLAGTCKGVAIREQISLFTFLLRSRPWVGWAVSVGQTSLRLMLERMLQFESSCSHLRPDGQPKLVGIDSELPYGGGLHPNCAGHVEATRSRIVSSM